MPILNETTLSNISNIMTNVTLRPLSMISKTWALSLLCQQLKICFDYRKMAKDVSNFNDILLHKEREIPCRKEVNVYCYASNGHTNAFGREDINQRCASCCQTVTF